MTCITNVILTTAIQDGAWMRSDTGSVDVLSDYLYRNYQGTRFSDVEVHAGGNKRMSCDVFMAAVDYLNVEAFIEQFNKVEWEKPEEAQLLIRTDGDKFFTSYRPTIEQNI